MSMGRAISQSRMATARQALILARSLMRDARCAALHPMHKADADYWRNRFNVARQTSRMMRQRMP